MPVDIGVIVGFDRFFLLAEATSILIDTYLLGIGCPT
jgi:hypothetical protein